MITNHTLIMKAPVLLCSLPWVPNYNHSTDPFQLFSPQHPRSFSARPLGLSAPELPGETSARPKGQFRALGLGVRVED